MRAYQELRWQEYVSWINNQFISYFLNVHCKIVLNLRNFLWIKRWNLSSLLHAMVLWGCTAVLQYDCYSRYQFDVLLQLFTHVFAIVDIYKNCIKDLFLNAFRCILLQRINRQWKWINICDNIDDNWHIIAPYKLCFWLKSDWIIEMSVEIIYARIWL